ncbi:hypothetical protein FQR65_LT10423 [Abscondita terminalis]|nr:hypothetical protein FQR65_LT10423 [Abscondita terminalis]
MVMDLGISVELVRGEVAQYSFIGEFSSEKWVRTGRTGTLLQSQIYISYLCLLTDSQLSYLKLLFLISSVAVDVDLICSANIEQFPSPLTEVTTASSMSPDTNSNEISESPEEIRKRMNGLHKPGAVPEEVLNNNGLSLHSLQRISKTGGTADDILNDSTSAKAAVGEQSEDDDKLQEYLQRRDTAVIYAEPVGRLDTEFLRAPTGFHLPSQAMKHKVILAGFQPNTSRLSGLMFVRPPLVSVVWDALAFLHTQTDIEDAYILNLLRHIPETELL